MSAFLVDPEHINVLLHTGLTSWYPGQELSWYYRTDDGHAHETLRETNADRVGQMLVDANAASVNHRYDEDNAYIYSYQPPRHTTWAPVELLKAIRCYEYQSCETENWFGSQAWEFCQALTWHIIKTMPGYADGTWEITTYSTPLESHITKGA